MTGVIRGVKASRDKGAARGLRVAALNTLGESNKRVPHEDGNLERDGAASVDESNMKAAVSYGRDADTKDYAVVQHEDLTLRHDPGRNGKYLENAFNTTREQNAQIIATAIREGLTS